MTGALRALLTEIVDYAGLFPPAALPLGEAIRNYVRYRQSADAWMLGRFIIPVAKLPALDEFAAEFLGPPSPLRLTVIGRGGEAGVEFTPNLAGDLAAMAAFEARHAGGQAATGARPVVVDAVEIRLPAAVVRDECTADLVRLLATARSAFADAGLAHVPLACEAPAGGERLRLNEIAAGGISFHNTKLALERRGTPADRVTLKVRCGGTTPDAFPSTAELAQLIAMAAGAEMGVPLKFTAGLHHPLPRFDPGSGARMHGFINVFAAVALAATHGLDADPLAALLDDDNPARFRFTDDALVWRPRESAGAAEFAVPLAELRQIRTAAALGFGSCSFDEPREDLQALGWS